MAKHIHIWLRGSTRDADGPAHVPAGSSKGGQFTSGSGGGGSAAKKTTYKGSKPDHIKSVSASKGKAVVHTNSGARHEISASSTGGKLPKVGEHIGQYTGASQKTASPAPSSKAGPVNQSSGPDEDKLRARVKAARAGMQAAGKNKAEYERHEQQFESSMEALTTLQEKNKAAGKK